MLLILDCLRKIEKEEFNQVKFQEKDLKLKLLC